MKKLLSAALLLLSLFTYTQAAEYAKMSITDITGKTYEITGTQSGLDIKGLEGKVVFVEFFGHLCGPCKDSVPHLINLQKKYKDKLVILAVEVQGYNDAQLKKFVKDQGINYITISGEKASQFVDYIQYRARWNGSIPFLVALDSKGDVRHIQAGVPHNNETAYFEGVFSEIQNGK